MKKLSVTKLALSYAGMFFGAGFVSGQEIRQFFGVYGTAGLFGLVLSALLFFVVGAAFFDAASASPEESVGELLVPGYHPLLSGAVEIAEAVLLFGVVVIMTAGAGAMVHQVTGIPAAAAGFVFAAAVFAASLRNIRSVLAVFSSLAPCLTVCAIAVAVYVLFFYAPASGTAGDAAEAAAQAGAGAMALSGGSAAGAGSSSPLLHGPLTSAVLYAVYNLFGSFSIMMAMVPLIPDRKKTTLSMGLGALFLLIPAECIAASIAAVPACASEEIPTAYLAGLIAPWFRNLYSVLMIAGMASAALGCLVGVLEQIRMSWSIRHGGAGSRGIGVIPYPAASAAACVTAWLLSLLGFGSLIGLIYPLFGYIGIPCVLVLIIRKFFTLSQ